MMEALTGVSHAYLIVAIVVLGALLTLFLVGWSAAEIRCTRLRRRLAEQGSILSMWKTHDRVMTRRYEVEVKRNGGTPEARPTIIDLPDDWMRS